MFRPVIVPFFIAHQGCPHRCVFCNQSKISSGTEALPSPAAIIEKVAAFRDTASDAAVEVAFFGGTFTSLPLSDQEELLLPLQKPIADGAVSGVRISTRPDAVDDEIARYLRERGVRVVELGAQSLDEGVLRASGRGHAPRDIADACHLLREHGFSVGLQLMTGLPGDTPEGCLSSLRQALDLSPDFLRIYPTLVIPGTELERRFLAGEYIPQSLDEAVDLCTHMLRLCQLACVPVIRMGLQPTEELSNPGGVVAGPYHPAFRQLVESRLCYDALCAMTRGIEGPVTVRCAPRRISDVTGQHRSNLQRLAVERGVHVEAVRPDPVLSPFELKVDTPGCSRCGSILHEPNCLTEVF